MSYIRNKSMGDQKRSPDTWAKTRGQVLSETGVRSQSQGEPEVSVKARLNQESEPGYARVGVRICQDS